MARHIPAQLLLIVMGFIRVSVVHANVCYAGTEPDLSGKVRRVLAYRNPCDCTKIRLGGHNVQVPWRPFQPRYLNKFVTTDDKDEIDQLLNCTTQKIVCEKDELFINCADDGDWTIDVKWALYGRQDYPEVCFYIAEKSDCGNEAQSTGIVKEHCQRKKQCRFTVTNDLFQHDPCPGYGKYLNVTFKCLPV